MTSLPLSFRARLQAVLATLVLAFVLVAAPAHASQIKVIVNGEPITSYDIQKRAAFLKLSRAGGGTEAAKKAMVDQALHMAEAKRLGIKVSDKQVSAAYQRFAAQNKLSTKQLDQILNASGVTPGHFKEFIRAQMSWGQAMQAKFRTSGLMKEQDAVKRMLEQGGQKPTATEYMLQQVIFVVPAKDRKSKLGQRRKEAEALRARFQGCQSTREFAKGLVDVTVRDLGRMIAQELPPDWEKQIKATKQGDATPVRETEKGIEFLGVCSTREVSDDRTAQMVFTMEGAGKDNNEFEKKYTDELRAKARIVEK